MLHSLKLILIRSITFLKIIQNKGIMLARYIKTITEEYYHSKIHWFWEDRINRPDRILQIREKAQ